MSGQGADKTLPAAVPLRVTMDRLEISISRLSALTGISTRMISRYTTGQVMPRDHFGRPSANALKIARVLDMDVDALFPLERAAA